MQKALISGMLIVFNFLKVMKDLVEEHRTLSVVRELNSPNNYDQRPELRQKSQLIHRKY